MKALIGAYTICLWFHIFLMSNSNFTIPTRQQAPEYLQLVIQRLEQLSPNIDSTMIKQHLKQMLEGQRVWNFIEQKKWYHALSVARLSTKQSQILQNALNSSDDAFWVIVHSDKSVQQAIEQSNILFTKDSASNPEHKMLFRCTYIKQNINSPEIIEKIIQSYKHAVVSLQWYFYAQALIQNDLCTKCMITVPDRHLSLFYFLDGYAEMISPRYKLYAPLHPHSLWQPHAYTRHTKDWPSKKLFAGHSFGIDFKENNLPDYCLPTKASHVLFGALDNQLTFISWLPYGFSLSTKDLSAFKNISQYFKSTDKHDGYKRTEKIPQDVMLHFKSLFSSNLTMHQQRLISKDGISAMIRMLDHDAKKLFEAFLKRKNYTISTAAYRKGNEIILQPTTFKNLALRSA